jgi:protein tyrosine phosphatase (PTP) superfamily phosphohydrolase (DUF442 family)
MNIHNFFQYNDKLSSGAQPGPEQIEQLKNNGFEVIVNISPASARNALKEEAQLVEQHKMDYIHFPVDCSNLRPIHYNTFKGIMNGLEGKKVFVHCGGNIKSSNLLHMYHVLEKGIDEAESFKTLRKIQNPELKWFGYFRSYGMMGISNI